jgi:AraC-like DNA-binding protein
MTMATSFIAETTTGWPLDSPFNDALEDLRISGSVLLHEWYAPPWAVDIPDEAALRAVLAVKPDVRVVPFHLVRRGAFDLGYAEHAPERIDTHEVAICPSGMPHRMSFGNPTAAIPITEILASHRPRPIVADPDATELICGVFQLRGAPLNPLLSALPRVLKVKTAGSDVSPLFGHAVAMLGIEVAKGPTSFVTTRLLEVFFAEALRAFGNSEGAAGSGWFKALNDPKIGLALSHSHKKPGAPWTVAALAETIAMSPSRFAARFREVTGQSAMSYVSNWRMTIACQRLRETDEHLAEIATAIGYQDTAAFSRAFKALVGHSPATWRSLHQA